MIEVPTDTQPEFCLEDTAEDIERKRKEREESESLERLQTEEIEREETEEGRTEKRATMDTDTDVESYQSRRKKGQIISIFLSDSNEEAIVKFVKQNAELCDMTHAKFKDKQRKEGLWKRLAASRNLSVNTVKKWFKTQSTRYGKLTHTKSGQAAVKSTEKQTWIHERCSFLQGHIRREGLSKSSAFKSTLRPSGATATTSIPDTSRETESEMKISMASDITHQPDTQQVSTQAVQTSQVAVPQPPIVTVNLQLQRSQQSSSSQPASFLLVDDQQLGPSRQLTFALSPTNTFNPPSVTFI